MEQIVFYTWTLRLQYPANVYCYMVTTAVCFYGNLPPFSTPHACTQHTRLVHLSLRKHLLPRPLNSSNTRCHTQALTFGDYRRPTILERCLLTLAAIGPVGWKAFCVLRSMRRTWSKVVVALVAPGLAWIVRSFIAYFYRQVKYLNTGHKCVCVLESVAALCIIQQYCCMRLMGMAVLPPTHMAPAG